MMNSDVTVIGKRPNMPKLLNVTLPMPEASLSPDSIYSHHRDSDHKAETSVLLEVGPRS